MNNTTSGTAPLTPHAFAGRISARLSEASDQLPYDITERLRAARVQAIEKRKQLLLHSATAVFSDGHSGTLISGHRGEHTRWWQRLGSLGLLLVLVCGLYAINVIQDELGARELADVDSALLTDDLPPAAYTDAGFTQFLKLSPIQDR